MPMMFCHLGSVEYEFKRPDCCEDPLCAGFKAGLSVSGGGAVMEPGQLGSPQWRRRSPLPICSPAHAYMAGQSSPPGALGARLRDLEPRLVLPALRALW